MAPEKCRPAVKNDRFLEAYTFYITVCVWIKAHDSAFGFIILPWPDFVTKPPLRSE